MQAKCPLHFPNLKNVEVVRSGYFAAVTQAWRHFPSR
jgi:hypothetical protein